MIRALISNRLAASERRFGVSLDYIHHIARATLGGFRAFARILPISDYRKALPHDVRAVARLIATMDEDCGGCAQLELNEARRAGVAREIMSATITREPERLPAPLDAVFRFTESVVRATMDEEASREVLREAFGERGLVELALTIAACRFFPIVKRALGHGAACVVDDLQY